MGDGTAPTWDSAPEKGLIDDFDFTITNAFFAPDASYMEGTQTLLHWEGTTDDPDNAEYSMFWGLGKGWNSPDGGKTIVHESDKADKFFNENSLIWRVINRCLEDFGLREVLAAKGSPLEAKVWPGLTFHMKREEMSYGKGIEPTVRLMPVSFVGGGTSGGTGGAAKASGTTKKAASSTGTKTAAEKLAEAKAKAEAKKAGGGSLADQLKALAAQHDEFESFQLAAMEVDGVTDDEELMNQILVPDEGIWAEAKG